jgi:uncharacterized protein YecT (DUF1311 family)
MNTFLPILLIFIATSGHAQTDEHPIDIRNLACHDIDSNHTTFGMKQCEYLASEEWKIEMNKFYDLLMDTLSTEAGIILKNAQEAWQAYYLAEQTFSRTLYYSEMDGTMWHVVNAGRLKEVMKQRAQELADYYNTFTFDGM